jgi:hypothetical protein
MAPRCSPRRHYFFGSTLSCTAFKSVIVLRRKLKGRAGFTNNDRWFFVQLYRWFPLILPVLVIIRPETLVRWHRGWLSPLLALEIVSTKRATADRDRIARADVPVGNLIRLAADRESGDAVVQ